MIIYFILYPVGEEPPDFFVLTKTDKFNRVWVSVYYFSVSFSIYIVMEKRDALIKLFDIAKQFNLNPEDIVNGLLDEKLIDRKKLIAIAKEKVSFFSAMKVNGGSERYQKKKVGMFYYAEDKSFSDELIPNKTVSGVVGYVGKSGLHGLVVLLHQCKLPWSSDGLIVGMPDLCGHSNTRVILQKALEKNKKAEAAQYCAEYTFDGVKSGKAFLACQNEMNLIFSYQAQINKNLALIKGADLLDKPFYWTSSEHSSETACYQNFSYGGRGYYSKYNVNYFALPVIEF